MVQGKKWSAKDADAGVNIDVDLWQPTRGHTEMNRVNTSNVYFTASPLLTF